ncbi:uncharacterized protein LOC133522804 isoform X1 [Cydia pomonella]|uniref:uncharacterized protein LOC133522804 isoform X1 n=1 Tax=Cydia pomonella TaxID=82600 RepID=UPI002ADE5CC0|nr:uncharacterized protein LOC133522804 isoform X1 [Cydia pomonella]
MISSIISRLVILVFGTLYPAYASYKAVRTKNLKEYVKWMMYWIVFALFTCTETFTDVFLSWFPFYYEVKIVLVLWLLSPATKGSSILYRKFVHPALCRREQEIDEYIAKAKDQGYHTVLNLGTKGVNYATTVIMQTAIKGGGGLVQQIRKSYSLSDLSECEVRDERGADEADDILAEPRIIRRVAKSSGYNTRRSASESNSRTPMYFPEVDVDVRGPRAVRADEPDFSHIKSTEDISSGYSSADNSASLTRAGSVGAAARARARTTRTAVTAIKRPQAAEDNEVFIEELQDDDSFEYANMPPLVNLPSHLFLSHTDPPFIYQYVGDEVKIIQVLGNYPLGTNFNENKMNKRDPNENIIYENSEKNLSPDREPHEIFENAEEDIDTIEAVKTTKSEELTATANDDNNNKINELSNKDQNVMGCKKTDVEAKPEETLDEKKHITNALKDEINIPKDKTNVSKHETIVPKGETNASEDEKNVAKGESNVLKVETNVSKDENNIPKGETNASKDEIKESKDQICTSKEEKADSTSLDTSAYENDSAESDDEASFGTPEDSPRSKRKSKSPKGKYGKCRAPPPPPKADNTKGTSETLKSGKGTGSSIGTTSLESLNDMLSNLPNKPLKETSSHQTLHVVNPIAEKKRRHKSKSPNKIPKGNSSGIGKLLQLPSKLAFWHKSDDKSKTDSTSMSSRSRSHSRRSSGNDQQTDFQSYIDINTPFDTPKEDAQSIADDQVSFVDAADFESEVISHDIMEKSDALQKLIEAKIESHPEYKFVSLHDDIPTASKSTDV